MPAFIPPMAAAAVRSPDGVVWSGASWLCGPGGLRGWHLRHPVGSRLAKLAGDSKPGRPDSEHRGGAGVFDGIFLVGIMAALLS
jgi:uncharacterized membrane protein